MKPTKAQQQAMIALSEGQILKVFEPVPHSGSCEFWPSRCTVRWSTFETMRYRGWIDVDAVVGLFRKEYDLTPAGREAWESSRIRENKNE